MNKYLPYQISGFNALILIGIGAYGYFQSQTPSPTALIPVVFGILLLAMNSGVKSENKIIAHIAVTATLLILIGLLMPLKSAFGKSDIGAIIRVSVMLLTTILALISFIQSFIKARKEREG
jgi:hypothetical protein|tara:strand:+ start:58 stop:420 length:363 start_codon:yes stop_codon:yes gene_type:complete